MSIPNAESVVGIKDDKAFIKEAVKLLEGSPNGTKGLATIKLNNKGKGSRKQLYLSLAHGDFNFIWQQCSVQYPPFFRYLSLDI
jgi:hypothetical protein